MSISTSSPIPTRPEMPELPTSYKPNIFERLTDPLFPPDQQIHSRHVKTLKAVQSCLSALEAMPFATQAGFATAETREQCLPYAKHVNAAIETFEGTHDKELKRCVTDLRRHATALDYRLSGPPNGATDPNARAATVALAMKWLKQQPPLKHRDISKEDLAQLEHACRHTRFADLILHDAITRDQFFKWTLRDRLDPDIFILYPATQQKISRAFLDKRVGRLGGDGLKIQKEHPRTLDERKIVTLKIEDRDVNILDETAAVTLQNNYTLTIKQIFDVFLNKNNAVGKLEYTAAGVINWNVFELGPWNPETEQYDAIDLTKDQWWDQLPKGLCLTASEVNERYGSLPTEGEWGVCPMGARTSEDLNFMSAHGWLEVVCPNEDGTFQILPFGKFAEKFPATVKEYIKVTGQTQRAKIEFPDENPFRVNRQQVGVLFSMNESRFLHLMSLIAEDIQKARDGDIVFQALGDNCASWVQKTLDKVFSDEPIPRLYELWYWDTYLPGLTNLIFGIPKHLPHPYLKDKGIKALLRVLGAAEGIDISVNGQKVNRSLVNSDFWSDKKSHIPANYMERVLKGEITGR